MCKFNVVDVITIQECLEGYKKLIEWIPPLDDDDENMKSARLQIIEYLSNACEKVLSEEKEKHNG